MASFDVLVEGALHARVVVLRVVPALLVAVLEIPQEGRAGSGAPMALRSSAHHLRGIRFWTISRPSWSDPGWDEQAAHGDHSGDGLLGRLLAGGACWPAGMKASPSMPITGPGAGARAPLAPVSRQPEQQGDRALHQVAVVVLARVPAHEDLGLARRHLPRQRSGCCPGWISQISPALLRRVVFQVTPQASRRRARPPPC